MHVLEPGRALELFRQIQAFLAEHGFDARISAFLAEHGLAQACDQETGRLCVLVSKYLLQMFLALVLWDFGMQFQPGNWLMIAMYNTHHVGVFIALQFRNEVEQAFQDSCFFAWLWAIHSFGLVLEVFFPLIGIRAKEGRHSYELDFVKHLYSMVTVRQFYLYLNGHGQPGLACDNYQSWALGIMIASRYLLHDNWRHREFFRRIEIPGFCIVCVDHFFGCDVYMHRAFGLFFGLLFTYITHAVFFGNVRSMPANYDLEESSKLQRFLEQEAEKTGDHLEKLPTDYLSFMVQWFETKTCKQSKLERAEGKPVQLWKEKWPLHCLAATGAKNAITLSKMLEDRAVTTADLNAQMTDWHNSAPLQWSVNLRNHAVTLVLLQNGANPYQSATSASSAKTAVDLAFAKGGGLGNCRNFWSRFHALCLEEWPPLDVPWGERPVHVRFLQVVKAF
ncbi:unnamed protein product [Amoebophrya sp. A25]|nr:unnamed protein product [Amoebophrya sp. A25]|eukprot:GSA25T00023923001.1